MSETKPDSKLKRTRRLWSRKGTRRRLVAPTRTYGIILGVLTLFAGVMVPFFVLGGGFGGRTILFGGGLLLACAFGLVDNFNMRGEKMWRRKRLPLFARLRFGRAGQAETCAFCRDAVKPAEHVTCPGCQVAYHPDCQKELLGGCGTIGCSEQGQRVRLSHPGKAPLKLTHPTKA